MVEDKGYNTTGASHFIHNRFSVTYDYKVLFTENLFKPSNSSFVDVFRHLNTSRPQRLVFVIDSEVARLHSNLIQDIKRYCSNHSTLLTNCSEPLVVLGGELAKNDFDFVNSVLRLIDDNRIDRHSYVVAIGGGAILDLVGFVASVAHRGIRHIRIPTTVLSQNDSGVGVKNGVNYFNKKNYLGTFSPPFAVINDSAFLTTLEDRDWRSGITEAIKVGLIKDASFYHWIENNVGKFMSRDLTTMETLIRRCAEIHVGHISTNGDPFELGSSRPLDFGHWAAHKIEQLANYEIRHGEAVAIGICLDVAYSFRIGLLQKVQMDHILNCFKKLGFEISHPVLFDSDGVNINPLIIKGLDEFSEHLGGELTIMLLQDIGIGIEVHEIDISILQMALEELYPSKIMAPV